MDEDQYPSPDTPMKITVTRGRTVIHEDVIPWRDVARAQVAWTRPLGANKNHNKFRSEPA